MNILIRIAIPLIALTAFTTTSKAQASKVVKDSTETTQFTVGVAGRAAESELSKKEKRGKRNTTDNYKNYVNLLIYMKMRGIIMVSSLLEKSGIERKDVVGTCYVMYNDGAIEHIPQKDDFQKRIHHAMEYIFSKKLRELDVYKDVAMFPKSNIMCSISMSPSESFHHEIVYINKENEVVDLPVPVTKN